MEHTSHSRRTGLLNALAVAAVALAAASCTRPAERSATDPAATNASTQVADQSVAPTPTPSPLPGPGPVVADPPAPSTPSDPTVPPLVPPAEPPAEVPLPIPPLPPPAVDPPAPTCGGECTAPVELTPLGVHRSPAGATDLADAAGAGAGCAVNCIVRGVAVPGADGHSIEVTVETDTAADITLWITRGQPEPVGHGDDGLKLRNGDAVARTTGDLDLWFTHTVEALEQDTMYWLTVRAEDERGGESWATGPVRTVRVAVSIAVDFVEIEVLYDGDKGRNRGELTFVAFNGDDAFADREGKWGDGSTIDLDSTEWSVGFVDVEGSLPDFSLSGVEQDPRGVGGLCTAGLAPSGSGVDDDCAIAWNTAHVDGLTWDQISELYRCEVYGVEGNLADAFCQWVPTTNSGNGVPEFRVLVAYSEWV